jgi:XTP/dITP diphosphohydrolase
MAVPLLIATTNPGKIREIQHELDLAGLHDHVAVRTLKDLPGNVPDCLEDRPTFIGNATKKARHFAAHANCLTLADDSGLAVDALHGAPGVISARYSGIQGDRHTVDAANNARLLREMDSVPDDRRTARFVCAMALATPHADLAVMVDDVHGTLLREPRGDGGFGYDPLFYFPRFHKTTAELSAPEKGKISHRGKALRRMIAWMRENESALATSTGG